MGITNGLLALYGVATAVRDTLSPDTQEKYQLYKFLPHWGWRTWVALFAILNVVLVIEGAIRAIWKRERVHQTEIDKHEARLVEHKDKISQLTEEPDINVRVKAVFWSSRKDESGYTYGDFLVRLELTNRNDVDCTIRKYSMLDRDQIHFHSRFPGMGVYGILKHDSPYGGDDTSPTPEGKETAISPIMISQHSPLKRLCSQEGWVRFSTLDRIMPTINGRTPSHWISDITIFVEDSSGKEHSGTQSSVAIFPAEFTPQ